ncbi:hypothetical protein GCM10010964_14490 [Caldovatus sediminis]|uniref:Uncharacterized protein n=1 Tax=Caldovatus sediminis TaxID=2041189 RepID=A0A8J2ZA87_9PROT|nr:hypothetical protein [Caldovatus sediminis]GGG27668.1 hypothetical protein GCM10010964_14490 [Caldovatus sediminis]
MPTDWGQMSESAKDPVAAAAARLEAAVERLGRAAAAARGAIAAARAEATGGAAAPAQGGGAAVAAGAGRAELAALAERLDATILKLRAALGEEAEDAAGAATEREGGQAWDR